jgi:dTDP-4-amino-4,6-dideoxygalactose transaminase
MDTASFLKLCKVDPEIEGVIAVHLYGFVLDMAPFLYAFRKYGIFIIEDFAQCQGAKYSSGQFVGSSGHFSIVSFGHTKVLDVGGGGLLLMDDIEAYKRALHISSQYVSLSRVHRSFLADSFLKSYYETWFHKDSGEVSLMRIGDMAYDYQNLYLRQGSSHEFNRLLSELPRLEECVSRRRSLWFNYYNCLKFIDALNIPPLNPGDVPWRFTFTTRNSDRDRIVSFLRSKQINVSNWYPPLYSFYPTKPDTYHNYSADSFFSRVINLWLDHQTTEAQVIHTCSILNEFFSL